MAGELEVVTSRDISQKEANCRLNILKDIMCAAGFYEWSAVKRLYVAIVTEVEMGISCWGDDTSRLEQQILMPFPLKKSVSKPESKVRSGKGKVSGAWFCAAYQKKECPHKENHQVEVNGKTLLEQHICASC